MGLPLGPLVASPVARCKLTFVESSLVLSVDVPVTRDRLEKVYPLIALLVATPGDHRWP